MFTIEGGRDKIFYPFFPFLYFNKDLFYYSITF